jgi:hypothetical protein
MDRRTPSAKADSRAAVGDFNGDGTDDLVIAAEFGMQGRPRTVRHDPHAAVVT